MYNQENIHNQYKVGVYIRLSEADNKSNKNESESIQNQRNIINTYIKEKDFNFISEYVDDGFTGTDFNRPGFQNLLKDIESKKIDLVIVKDMSRLGRDHILTGYYVEKYFPEKGVRFISIQESYDSAINQASNDSSTFIFACNDYYSKQNSIKIRNVLNNKKTNGKFIGSMACYGYKKDPNDKGHLIPDPKYAPIVKKIFNLAYSGISITNIATYLNNRNIKTPSSLKHKKNNSKAKYNYMWTNSSIKSILKNQIYVGDMVQSKQVKVSYKSKKKITLPKSNWIIVPNTHEAIVDRFVFESVQNNAKKTGQTKILQRKKRIFENLMYCKECGNTLSVSYRKKQNYWVINCNKYSRDPKRRMCEPHFFPYDKLEKLLLETIKNTCKKYIDINNIIKNIKVNYPQRETKKINELLELKNIYLKKIDMLYQDRFEGIISEDTYKRISNDTEMTLKFIEDNLKKIKATSKININKIKKIINIEIPSRQLIQIIVDRIIIDKNKNIEIIYKFSV